MGRRKKKAEPVTPEPTIEETKVEPPAPETEDEQLEKLPDPEPKPGDEPVVEQASDDDEEPPASTPSVPEKPELKKFNLPKGKSLSCKAGIVTDVEAEKRGGVDETYFVGGSDTVVDLLRRGLLVERR
jgi:hypothetical protein